MIYGYCRISTPQQNIERQIRNIKSVYSNAIIVQEAYTGTKINRPRFDNLLRSIESGDTIIFDSVSRMSRNAEDGFALYERLFRDGISLVFLKEPHINTDTYKKALANHVSMTGDKVDYILEGINKYLMELAKEQIKIAFDQSQKEVDDLRQRTKEGMQTAKLNGKQIGQVQGRKLHTKKSDAMKPIILKKSKFFNGSMNDTDLIKVLGISRNTFYRYKGELLAEFQKG